MASLILPSGSSQNSAARWMVHGVTCSTRMSQLVRYVLPLISWLPDSAGFASATMLPSASSHWKAFGPPTPFVFCQSPDQKISWSLFSSHAAYSSSLPSSLRYDSRSW